MIFSLKQAWEGNFTPGFRYATLVCRLLTYIGCAQFPRKTCFFKILQLESKLVGLDKIISRKVFLYNE